MNALHLARDLCAMIHAECAALEHERIAYRTLDSAALLTRLTDRAVFQDRASRLSRDLHDALVETERTPTLRDALTAVRRSSRVMFELARQNQALVTRTSTLLGGVIDAVSPAPKTYDLRGHKRSRPAAAYARVSRRV